MPLSRFLSVTVEGLTQPSERGGSGGTGQEQMQHHGDVHWEYRSSQFMGPQYLEREEATNTFVLPLLLMAEMNLQ